MPHGSLGAWSCLVLTFDCTPPCIAMHVHAQGLDQSQPTCIRLHLHSADLDAFALCMLPASYTQAPLQELGFELDKPKTSMMALVFEEVQVRSSNPAPCIL